MWNEFKLRNAVSRWIYAIHGQQIVEYVIFRRSGGIFLSTNCFQELTHRTQWTGFVCVREHSARPKHVAVWMYESITTLVLLLLVLAKHWLKCFQEFWDYHLERVALVPRAYGRSETRPISSNNKPRWSVDRWIDIHYRFFSPILFSRESQWLRRAEWISNPYQYRPSMLIVSEIFRSNWIKRNSWNRNMDMSEIGVVCITALIYRTKLLRTSSERSIRWAIYYWHGKLLSPIRRP